MRIYFVGAQSTGKTTLAKWASQHYNIKLIPEAARLVLDEWKSSLSIIRLDPEQADKFQLEVWQKQRFLEDVAKSFVADRACDHLAYAAEYSSVAGAITRDPAFQSYMTKLCAPDVAMFFVRPHKELIKDDGVRVDLSWESAQRIDAMVKLILKCYGIPYVELPSKDVDSRIQTIKTIVGRLEKETKPCVCDEKSSCRSTSAEKAPEACEANQAPSACQACQG